MSEMSARARRRAFCLGSCTMNGFTGRSGPVDRFPGVLTPGAGAGARGGGGGGCTAGLGTVSDGAGAAGGAIGLAGRAGANGGRASGGAVGIAGRLIEGGGADGGAIAGRGGGGAGGAGAARGGAGTGGGAVTRAAGAAEAAGAAGAGAGAGAGLAPSGLTAKTLLHTLQRARRPPAGTLAGSTRYTVSHDGHVTFTPRCLRFLRHRDPGRGADPPRRPTPPASLRSSSFPSPAR